MRANHSAASRPLALVDLLGCVPPPARAHPPPHAASIIRQSAMLTSRSPARACDCWGDVLLSILIAAVPGRYRRGFCATRALLLSLGCRHLPHGHECDARKKGCQPFSCAIGPMCSRSAADKSSRLSWCDRVCSATATDNGYLHMLTSYPPREDNSHCESLFSWCHLAMSRKHHGRSQHSGAIDSVAQPRYRWHVDSHAQDNVPQLAWPHLRCAMQHITVRGGQSSRPLLTLQRKSTSGIVQQPQVTP